VSACTQPPAEGGRTARSRMLFFLYIVACRVLSLSVSSPSVAEETATNPNKSLIAQRFNSYLVKEYFVGAWSSRGVVEAEQSSPPSEASRVSYRVHSTVVDTA
jgi:hypothetical protein